MSNFSSVRPKSCDQWSRGHLLLEFFHRNLIEASKFSMRTEEVEGKAHCKPLVSEAGNKPFPKKEKWGWEWKSFVAKQDMFRAETPWIQGRIFQSSPFFFSDGYSVTQGKHGKGCSWRSEKSQWRLYLWREMGDGSDWEAAGLCCLALTVSNCCWHSGGLFWPRPALGTAEKLRLLEFSPFTIHSATWLQKSI